MGVFGRIAGTLHVGASYREVVDRVRQAFKPEFLARTDPEKRAILKRAYQEALASHIRARGLYDSIYGGGASQLEVEITERLYGGAETRAAIEAAERGE